MILKNIMPLRYSLREEKAGKLKRVIIRTKKEGLIIIRFRYKNRDFIIPASFVRMEQKVTPQKVYSYRIYYAYIPLEAEVISVAYEELKEDEKNEKVNESKG